MKRALVSSGGGAMGAWGGGLSKTLHKNNSYDYYIGTSTGSMLQTLSAIYDFDKLKDAYTEINTDNIFKVNPFNKKNKENIFVIIKSVLKKQLSFGDSTPLLKTIREFFTEEDFRKVLKTNKDMFVTTTNLSKISVEYKNIKDYKYEEFIEWIYASSCVYPYMSPLVKNKNIYVDGGFVEHIPIQKAIDDGCNVIDVIAHRPEKYNNEFNEINNVFEGFKSIMKVMHREITNNDIVISKLKAKDKNVEVNIYFTPYKLTENSLIFDKKQMLEWWILGENHKITDKRNYKITL